MGLEFVYQELIGLFSFANCKCFIANDRLLEVKDYRPAFSSDRCNVIVKGHVFDLKITRACLKKKNDMPRYIILFIKIS